MERIKRKRAKGTPGTVQRKKKQVGLDLNNKELVRTILNDVETYIVAWSLGNTVDMLEDMIKDRQEGGMSSGFFVKNKAKDLRLLKDHLEACKIVMAWYSVPEEQK